MIKKTRKKPIFIIAAILGIAGIAFFISNGFSQESYAVTSFTEVGEHTWIVPEGVSSVDVLVVGGGGGTTEFSGGGGGGGLVFKERYSVTSGESILIKVGDGGTGRYGSETAALNGENSTFGALTAIGGGGGVTSNMFTAGWNGGSGGGIGPRNGRLGGVGMQPTSTDGGFGNNGGNASAYTGNDGGAGGGGGAGGPGQAGALRTGGHGGDGLYYGDIFGDQFGENGWFAGGGGGMGDGRTGANITGEGGLGGGGKASTGNAHNNAEAGQGSTGGGAGGGGPADTSQNGADGGSGVVLIRYKTILGRAQSTSLNKGLVGHWSMDKRADDLHTQNLAPYTDYTNRTYDSAYTASCWGGDLGTIHYYKEGGYNNLPYKKMTKTAAGSGGCFHDNHSGIIIEDNKTYIVSAWMKANRDVTLNGYALDLNRAADNAYKVGPNINLTTQWQRIYWQYNSGTGHSGIYHARNIVYIDDGLPLEVYWSGFQVEEGNSISPYVNGTRQSRLLDSTANTNHGSIYGSTFTEDRYGKEGGAMSFNGTTDYIGGLDSSALLSEYYTVTAWFKSDSSTSLKTIFATESTNYGFQVGFLNQPNTGQICFYSGRGGTSDSLVSNSNTYNDNNWHHVAFVRNGETIYLFIDGELDGSRTRINSNLSNVPLQIGNHRSLSRYFDGSIDDVRVYNRALSESEIKSLYDSYNSKTITSSLQKDLVLDMPLKSRYTKDETVGSEILTDRTPYSNDGQNYGATITEDGATFDGINDYIQIPPKDNLDITKSITLSVWYKIPELNVTQRLITKKASGGTYGLGYETSFYASNRFLTVYNNGDNRIYLYSNYINTPDDIGKYFHYTYVYNYEEGYQKAFVNGQDFSGVGSFTAGHEAGSTDGMVLDVGRRDLVEAKGELSNLRIYARALSDEEVLTLYERNRDDIGIVFKAYGSTEDNPGLSCADILEKNTSAKHLDGLYWINPEGSGAFQVYCDMTTDGGGWTLVEKDFGGSSTVPVSSSNDTNTSILLNTSWSTSEGKFADTKMKAIWQLGDNELLWRKSTGEYVKLRYSDDFINNYWFSNFHYASRPAGVFLEFYRYADGNWYAINGHSNNWHFSNYNDAMGSLSSYRMAKNQNDGDAYWPTRSTGLMDNQTWQFHMYIR